MTFDFAPESTTAASTASTSITGSIRLTVSKPTFAVAHIPTAAEMTGLVAELFKEGCLTWEQMRSLAELPDFGTALLDTVTNAPATDKKMAAE